MTTDITQGDGSDDSKGAVAAAWSLLSSNPLLPLVALAGFAASFETIANLARKHGLPGSPYMYPGGIDVGILALVIESRRAIEDSRSDLVPRVLAWVLSGFTIYVNAHGSAGGDWTGRALHIVMPSLWVAFLELTRWRRIRKAAKERGTRDRIPLAHWLASPVPTMFMWRRMVLRDIKSYSVAIRMEDARRLARDLCRAHYGKGWKRQAPQVLTARIRAGRLGPAVLIAATADAHADIDEAVRAMVTLSITAGDQLTLKVRQERERIDRQDEHQKPPPAERRKPPRTERQQTLSASARRRAAVEKILGDNWDTPLPEVVAKTGASPATVGRVKQAMAVARASQPPALAAVHAAQ